MQLLRVTWLHLTKHLHLWTSAAKQTKTVVAWHEAIVGVKAEETAFAYLTAPKYDINVKHVSTLNSASLYSRTSNGRTEADDTRSAG